MKILHSADWHLDAPMVGHSPENQQALRRELRKIPDKIAKLCLAENCDLMLLVGDLFDGIPSRESLTAVRTALEKVKIPVVIAPGNHDFCTPNSPYKTESWPKNVHIFTKAAMDSIAIPALDCRIYGAGFEAMDCPGLLKGFHASGNEKWKIGILHGEVSASSAYCPMTRDQIKQSGLHYLALGHIHKGGSVRADETLCAWPGCPMGRGFDELGEKGVILTELGDTIKASFIPLDTPRFYDEATPVNDDPLDAIAGILPAFESQDFYRITLTGYSDHVDLPQLQKAFPHIPNLILRDETMPEPDLWSAVGQDSLEGVFFGILQKNANSDSETIRRRAKLAARMARQILDGQEVVLP